MIDRNISSINTVLDFTFLQQYQPEDSEYWGLGLENECYLQSSEVLEYDTKPAIQKRLSRERYSVNYMKNYPETINEEMVSALSCKKLKIPQLLNAHCFTRMDRNGEPTLTYTKNPQPNPKFIGKTVYEEWTEHDPEIIEFVHSTSREHTPIFFDGDSIEFVTTRFYRATTRSVVDELCSQKQKFLSRFHEFLKQKEIFSNHLPFRFLEIHPALSAMMTQPHRLVPFNNTTFHIHLTLPTEISNGKICDLDNFQKRHQQAITILQWFQPYFLSRLGSPDFLTHLFEPESFAGGSMRGAMSRYIGIGTYDPRKMTRGKIQTLPVADVRPPSSILWWRDQLNQRTRYILPLNEIGLDMHFAKHYQCGIELRWLDGFPIEYLKQVLDLIMLIACYALQVPFEEGNIAILSQEWNDIVYDSLVFGTDARLSKTQQEKYLEILQLSRSEFELEESCSWQSFFEKISRSMLENLEEKEILRKLAPDFEWTVLPDMNLKQHEFHDNFIQGK